MRGILKSNLIGNVSQEDIVKIFTDMDVLSQSLIGNVSQNSV